VQDFPSWKTRSSPDFWNCGKKESGGFIPSQSPDFCGVVQLGWCFQNFLEFLFLGNRTHDLFLFRTHDLFSSSPCGDKEKKKKLILSFHSKEILWKESCFKATFFPWPDYFQSLKKMTIRNFQRFKLVVQNLIISSQKIWCVCVSLSLLIQLNPQAL